jgi:hypothetical protein
MSDRTLVIGHELSLDEFIQALLEDLDEDEVIEFFENIADEIDSEEFDRKGVELFKERVTDEEDLPHAR